MSTDLEKEINRLTRERDALAEALRWYVEEDDTNETEDNQYWLDGRDRAIAVLESLEK